MPFMRLLSLPASVFAIWAASCYPINAQLVSASQIQMPETIDGATSPELIPDDLALGIWLLAVGEPSSSGTDALLRMKAKLAPVALSPDDQVVLTKAVAHFADMRESFRVREEQLAGMSAMDSQQPRRQLATDRQSLYTETKQLIAISLSAEGQQSFKQHLLRVKQHMHIGQGPRM